MLGRHIAQSFAQVSSDHFAVRSFSHGTGLFSVYAWCKRLSIPCSLLSATNKSRVYPKTSFEQGSELHRESSSSTMPLCPFAAASHSGVLQNVSLASGLTPLFEIRSFAMGRCPFFAALDVGALVEQQLHHLLMIFL
jgi:hypothetical protein